MGCEACKNVYLKSAQTAYNNAAQTVAAAGTTVNVLGTLACDTGCSISTTAGGFTINNSGLYRISYDIGFTAGADAGTAVFQLYNGATPLPCAVASQAAVANGTYAEHLETTLYLTTCAQVHPAISAQASGLAGTVTHVCASVVRLA